MYHLQHDLANVDQHYSETGPDGNPLVVVEGRVMRRMWAGGSFDIRKPIIAGDSVSKEHTIIGVEETRYTLSVRVSQVMCCLSVFYGRSSLYGKMVVLTRQDTLRDSSGDVCMVEKKQHVYLDHTAQYSPPVEETPGPTFDSISRASAGESRGLWEEVEVDSVSLFRYSALTWNSHRVHYDRDYAVNVEGYPGTCSV
jgi:3-methylfumaryl-CoA hydratase